MAFKDLIGRWSERRASRGTKSEDGSEVAAAAEAAAAAAEGEKEEEELSKGKKAAAAAAALAGGMKSQPATGQGGDLATQNLTWLASQNKWGNIKGLGKPGVSQPTVNPTKPAAQQEEEEEEEEKEPEQAAEEGLVPEETAAALDSRINDLTESNMPGAANIFDVAKGAK